MKDITRIEIELLPNFNPEIPWFVKVSNPIFSTQKRFVTLPDALAWTIKEAVEE